MWRQRQEPSPPSEEELVAAARAGSPDAFGQLFERYRQDILRYFRRRVRDDSCRAEDLVQDTFQHALVHIGELKDDMRFPAWLHAIARRTLLMNERVHKRRPSISLDWLYERATTDRHLTCISASIETHADRELLLEAFHSLTPALQRAFMLRYVHGYSDAEIAHMEQITPSAAQSRAHRASKEMRIQLDELVQQSRRLSVKDGSH